MSPTIAYASEADRRTLNALETKTCYGIVRLYGGLISAESEVGRGSTFVVYLPIGRMP